MKALQWYPLRVRGGQEEKIKLRIEEAIQESGLAELYKETFVPFQRVYLVKNGKKTIKKQHFGYIVLHADLSVRALCDVILDTQGVYGFYSEAGEGAGKQYAPSALPKDEVDRMLGLQAQDDEVTHEMKHNFVVGETVEIIDGVLKNKTAIVRSVDVAKKKVEATIKIFGKDTITEIAFAQLKKV